MGLSENLGAAAIDAAYAVYGRVASYSPPGAGPSVDCIVLFDIRDVDARPEDGTPTAGQAWIEVRDKEVTPAFRGTFTMGTKILAIISRPIPADGDGYSWKMWVE